jgi:hypothetical protein
MANSLFILLALLQLMIRSVQITSSACIGRSVSTPRAFLRGTGTLLGCGGAGCGRGPDNVTTAITAIDTDLSVMNLAIAAIRLASVAF